MPYSVTVRHVVDPLSEPAVVAQVMDQMGVLSTKSFPLTQFNNDVDLKEAIRLFAHEAVTLDKDAKTKCALIQESVDAIEAEINAEVAKV